MFQLFKSEKYCFCFRWIEINKPLFCPIDEYLEFRGNNTLNIMNASGRVK